MLWSLFQDDMEAYRTQNRFLNSEIHQVTKIWRRVAEKEKALLMKVRAGFHLQAQPSFGPSASHPYMTLSLSTVLPLDCAPYELSFQPQASVLC